MRTKNNEKTHLHSPLISIFFLSLFISILWPTTYPLKGWFSSRAFFVFDPLVMVFISLSERVFAPGIVFAIAMAVLCLE